MRPLLSCLLLFVLTQSCQNQKPKTPEDTLREYAKDPNFNASELKYDFDLPAGWHRLDTALQGLRFTYLFQRPIDEAYRPTMNVINEFMQGKSPEEYLQGAKKGLSSAYEIESVGEGEMTTRMGKALWHRYNRTVNGKQRENIFYSIPINGTSFNVTAGVAAGGLPTYRPVFDSIVQSFHIVSNSRIKAKNTP